MLWLPMQEIVLWKHEGEDVPWKVRSRAWKPCTCWLLPLQEVVKVIVSESNTHTHTTLFRFSSIGCDFLL
eukprot:m.239874 g.239874  ORF g.239874 m.239874 type:complete len:70 (+) comp14154_c0_seq1:1139-1348(+)